MRLAWPLFQMWKSCSPDCKDADDTVQKIIASIKTLTGLRESGRKENEEAIAEAELAQQSILQAIGVLEGFYKDLEQPAVLSIECEQCTSFVRMRSGLRSHHDKSLVFCWITFRNDLA